MSSSWLRSENARLAGAAVAASALTLLSVTTYQSVMKQKRRELLQKEVKDALATTPPEPELHSTSQLSAADLVLDESRLDIAARRYDETIIKEMLARNYAFFGEESMKKVRGGRVVVVGCGGVGSWAAVMLMRSGVSHIRLVDFDMVTLSSLNRHAVATLADVGVPKVTACKRFFERVAPWAKVDARVELWKEGSGGEDLLWWGAHRWIGSLRQWELGQRVTPRGYKSGPLGQVVRRRLRLENIESGIPVVYSTEKPSDVKLLPLPQEEYEKGNVHELGAFDDFRVRILPVLGPLPALFDFILQRTSTEENSTRNLRGISLTGEPGYWGGISKLPLSEQDVAYIFEDLHRGRSTIPPHSVLARPQLSRWNAKEPLTTSNCVVLSHQEAQLLQEHGGIGEEVVQRGLWPSETLEVVRVRQREAAAIARWEI
ncbi:ThiF family [Rhizoctonia solani]|uniref:ThiF family n=1 Tax=Rhizoctonia solani TaxID=456999 RepID=A0A8H7IA39_9AGAM|nr:ThiF family [Rhizoctonia solani]